ncbi:hypothetical protein [Ferruginibacter sp.]
MKYNLQKIGGIAAIVEALAYITGFTVLIFLLTPENAETLSNADKLQFLLNNRMLFQIWMLIIYVIFGISLVVLVSAITERLKNHSIANTKIAAVFGYIWAAMVIASGMIAYVGLDTVAEIYLTNKEQATTIWLTIDAIHNGIGGGVEVVGGLWVLLISWTAIKCGEFQKTLNYVGFLVGIAGVLTAVPGLSALGAVFGLLQIIWFAWIGVFLLRHP